MAPQSPTYQLADTLLNGELRNFVEQRRIARASWRRIAIELRDATERQIDVTAETLRTWFADLEAAA